MRVRAVCVLCVAMIMGSDRRDAEHLFVVVVVVFAVVVLNVPPTVANVPPTVAINCRPHRGSDN